MGMDLIRRHDDVPHLKRSMVLDKDEELILCHTDGYKCDGTTVLMGYTENVYTLAQVKRLREIGEALEKAEITPEKAVEEIKVV